MSAAEYDGDAVIASDTDAESHSDSSSGGSYSEYSVVDASVSGGDGDDGYHYSSHRRLFACSYGGVMIITELAACGNVLAVTSSHGVGRSSRR